MSTWCKRRGSPAVLIHAKKKAVNLIKPNIRALVSIRPDVTKCDTCRHIFTRYAALFLIGCNVK